MKIAPFSERTQFILLSPIIIPICAAFLVAIGPCVPFIWMQGKISEWWKRRLTNRGDHLWFAWYPVRLSGLCYDRSDQYVWLEKVQRRYRRGWMYRFPGEVDIYERQELGARP